MCKLGPSAKESPIFSTTKVWAHTLSIPREILLVDGRLRQKPIYELTILRNSTPLFDGEISGEKHFELTSDSYCLELDVDFAIDPQVFALDINGAFKIQYRSTEKTITISRKNWSTHEIEERVRGLATLCVICGSISMARRLNYL